MYDFMKARHSKINQFYTFCHSKKPAPIHLNGLIACGMGSVDLLYDEAHLMRRCTAWKIKDYRYHTEHTQLSDSSSLYSLSALLCTMVTPNGKLYVIPCVRSIGSDSL